MNSNPKSDVKDLSLTREGLEHIEWAGRDMPVLTLIRERFEKEKPLEGIRVSGCLHVTSETANLAIALQAGGADVALCASNPLSTQDDVAAALVSEYGIATYAIKGEDDDTYYGHIRSALDAAPNVTMDDGADLVATIHQERKELIRGIIGGTEETTTGVIRLKAMAKEGMLRYPIIAVNEADTKHFFDNRYGTGQSTLDGITRATNLLWAGKKVVVMGYGWCGRGIAQRATGHGFQRDSNRGGPRAGPGGRHGRVHCFAQSRGRDRRGRVHLGYGGASRHGPGAARRDDGRGAVGQQRAFQRGDRYSGPGGHGRIHRLEVRPFVQEYTMKDGRRLYLLAEGRLVNLAAAEGHPSSVMDMSFANQALSVEYLATRKEGLEPRVYPVPKDMDMEVGRLKLRSMGVTIDTLTDAQWKYLNSWEEGT